MLINVLTRAAIMDSIEKYNAHRRDEFTMLYYHNTWK